MSRYQLHENDPADDRYLEFLSLLTTPLLENLSFSAERKLSAIDYGSGPGPALQKLLPEQIEVTNYDPFFQPDSDVLHCQYDLVLCTETAEHFIRPADEFSRLLSLLRPGGLLGLMTLVFSDEGALKEWRYARDPTHVVFYREKTMHWIARKFGIAMIYADPRVFIFRSPDRIATGEQRERLL